jgi:hypothetical protein
MNEKVRAAIGAVIEDAGAKMIAQRMGVNVSTIYAWAESKPMPWERFEQLHHITGDARPIAALCQSLGGVFLPQPERAGELELDMILAIKNFATLVEEVSTALLDKRIEPAELRRIQRAGAPTQRAIAILLGAVQKMAEKR